MLLFILFGFLLFVLFIWLLFGGERAPAQQQTTSAASSRSPAASPAKSPLASESSFLFLFLFLSFSSSLFTFYLGFCGIFGWLCEQQSPMVTLRRAKLRCSNRRDASTLHDKGEKQKQRVVVVRCDVRFVLLFKRCLLCCCMKAILRNKFGLLFSFIFWIEYIYFPKKKLLIFMQSI